MKAFVYDKYGSPDVLELRDIEKPSPKTSEVLVRVQSTSLNAYDWHLMRADPFLVRVMGGGLLKPQLTIPGADIAGVVEAVGSGVDQFHPGDAVFGSAARGSGGFAEFAIAQESGLVLKPSNLSFEQAAAVPMAGITALQGLRDAGQIQPGQKVLIHGASGGVGTFAVQLARVFGAEITAVCSTSNVERVRSLGADHVIDYKKEDFTQNGKLYDLILAVNGYHPLSVYKRSLSPKGKYVMAGGTNAQILQALFFAPLMSNKGGKEMGGVSAKRSQKDLQFLGDLLKTGKIVPVIDRTFPFSEAVNAMRYIDAGHACGKVIVNVGSSM